MPLAAFGFHTYAGGLAAGVAKHFDLLGLGEHDGYGNAIKVLNFPGVPLYGTFPEWPRAAGRGAQRCRFVFANPPCAPFSVASAGRATAWHEDPRLAFFHDIFGLLPDVRPDVMAIESVTQSWLKGREMINGLARDAAREGYATTVLLHDAYHVGNVQRRSRVFYVFHRVAVDWDPPRFDSPLTVGQVLKRVKVSAAERKRYGPEASLLERRRALYEATPQGSHLHKTFNELNPDAARHEDGRVIGRPGFLTVRLSMTKPSPVVIGGNHVLHPTEPRALLPSELGAIVGFPSDWRWPDGMKLDRIATFASQGVSPDVGEWLARGVAKSIELGKRLNRPIYQLRDERRDPVVRELLSDDPAELVVEKFVPAVAPPKEVKPPRLSAATGEPIARPVRTGSGAYIRELLLAGTTEAEILRLNKARFPESKAGPSDVAWNRAKLRAAGTPAP